MGYEASSPSKLNICPRSGASLSLSLSATMDGDGTVGLTHAGWCGAPPDSGGCAGASPGGEARARATLGGCTRVGASPDSGGGCAGAFPGGGDTSNGLLWRRGLHGSRRARQWALEHSRQLVFNLFPEASIWSPLEIRIYTSVDSACSPPETCFGHL